VGQQKTAAPVFSNELDHLSQPDSTPNFYPLSVICQSLFHTCISRGSQNATFWFRSAAGGPQRRGSQAADENTRCFMEVASYGL
jgi:hypothetical protein